MTDKEIIKAMECCADESSEKCDECPYSIDTLCCKRMELRKDCLDLINRQQGQLEAAISGQETLQKALAEKNVEIERLNNNLSAMAVTMHNCAKATRAEAIRAFAERLKAEFKEMYFAYDCANFCEIFDNLVKEMVGDAE